MQPYPKCFILMMNMFLLFQLRAQTWKLLHHKDVLCFFFFITGFPPELRLAERILVLMI